MSQCLGLKHKTCKNKSNISEPGEIRLLSLMEIVIVQKNKEANLKSK